MKIYDFHLWLRPTVGDSETLTSIVLEAPVPMRTDTVCYFPESLLSEEMAKHHIGTHRPEESRGRLRVRRARGPDELSTIGRVLFDVLFPRDSPAFELLGRSCSKALNEKDGEAVVRLLLDLHSSLSDLPWELLRSPGAGGPHENKIKQARISVVRYLGKVAPKRHLDERRRVLVMVTADPDIEKSTADGKESRLTQSFKREEEGIRDLLSDTPGIELEPVTGRDTLREVSRRIRDLEKNGTSVIGFHFIGHGGSDAATGGYLVGLDENGRRQRITRDQLRVAIEPAKQLRWVFLNACSTGWGRPGSPLSSVAYSVSEHSHVPAVIAYLRLVGSVTAEKLAGDFYSEFLVGTELDAVLRNVRYTYGDKGGLVLIRRLSTGYLLPEMVPIPAGTLPSDSELKKLPADLAVRLSKHQGRRFLFFDLEYERRFDSYAISKYPVTNRQFECFVEESEYRTIAEKYKAPFNWRDASGSDAADHPVVNVSRRDAEAYCDWVTEKLRLKNSVVRIPTLEEWLRAFCGDSSAGLYPWGAQFDKSRCQGGNRLGQGETAPVDHHERGASPFGVVDLVGNVAEWTGSEREGMAVVVGGSCFQDCELLGLYGAGTLAPKNLYFRDVGFRCVKVFL